MAKIKQPKKTTSVKKPMRENMSLNTLVKNPRLLANLFTKKALYIILAVILFLLIAYFLKNQLVVATVNGEPIYRLQLISQLEKQEGKRILDEEITKKLLAQEAVKQKITVSESEIESQLKNIEENVAKSGQDFDSLLKLQGLTRDKLKENIRLQMLAEKMASSNIQISDKEIIDYMEQNKESLPQSTSEAELKQEAKNQLEQQKINSSIQTLLQDIRKKAKIDYLFNF